MLLSASHHSFKTTGCSLVIGGTMLLWCIDQWNGISRNAVCLRLPLFFIHTDTVREAACWARIQISPSPPKPPCIQHVSPSLSTESWYKRLYTPTGANTHPRKPSSVQEPRRPKQASQPQTGMKRCWKHTYYRTTWWEKHFVVSWSIRCTHLTLWGEFPGLLGWSLNVSVFDHSSWASAHQQADPGHPGSSAQILTDRSSGTFPHFLFWHVRAGKLKAETLSEWVRASVSVFIVKAILTQHSVGTSCQNEVPAAVVCRCSAACSMPGSSL